MRRTSALTWLGSLVALAGLLALACTSAATPTSTPTPAPVAAPTPTVARVATLAPTAAPAATSTPTAAPSATATPTKAAPAATATPTSVRVATATPTVVAAATPTATRVVLTTTPADQPKRGGNIKVWTRAHPANYDLQITPVIRFYTALGKLYNTVFFNPTGTQMECDLCDSWRLENDGKRMVFNLRRDIKFHDGSAFDSGDLKYSLDKMMGTVDGVISPRCGVVKEYIDSVEAPDANTMHINLNRASAFVPKVLSIAPCVVYPAGTTRQQLQKAPAGSGPFTLTRNVEGTSILMSRNPNYFKKGLPYLESIEVLTIGDPSASVSAFLTHQLDVYLENGAPSKQFAPMLKQLKDQGKIQSYREPLNCRPGGVRMNMTKPPFDNIKMRQAVNLAIDRKEHGAVVQEGEYFAAILFDPTSEFGRPENEVWDVAPGWGTGDKKAQEIAQAKQMVIDAGYPQGLDIPLMAQLAGTGENVGATLLQRQLTKINVRTSIQNVTTQEADVRRGNLDYVIEGGSFCQTTGDPDEVIGGYFITGAARNWYGYSSPQIDKLYLQISSASDPVQRRALVRQAEEIISFTDVVNAHWPDDILEHWWWSRVHGYQLGLSQYSSTLNRMEDWWVSE